MTTSTTLKLPETLRVRIAPLARSAGKTPHAWMIEALEAQAELAELRRAFVQDALESAAEVDAGGPLYAMEDVHAYIAKRAAGQEALPPGRIAKNVSPTRARTRRSR